MSWLTPIGFLGLLGLIALLIIYIIKPNYQNKIVSSTFIWKLSLKLRKKQIPISKLRNILLFICQVLAICALAFILAQPVIAAEKEEEKSEKIAIIDASLSMFTEYDDTTRFERAVEAVRTLATEVFATERDTITVILAGDNAKVLASSVDFENQDLVFDALNELVDPAKKGEPIVYSKGDIEGAIKLAEEKTAIDPHAEVLLYSDTKYIDPGKVIVKNKEVVDPNEWNASILDVRAVLVDNYYRLEIDVACYGGWDKEIEVLVKFHGLNGIEGYSEERTVTVPCVAGETKTIVFAHKMEAMPDGEATPTPEPSSGDEIAFDILEYEKIVVTTEESDCFKYDNSFELHDGTKPKLRIQYASSLPNNFFATSLLVLRDTLSKRWTVEFVEVKPYEEPETRGFDFYIFEHDCIPSDLPSDGVVILANPSKIPTVAGITLGKNYTSQNMQQINLSAGESEHPLMKNITAESITVTKFTELKAIDDEYATLMTVQGTPVVMAKNAYDQKIVVMSFSLNYSNLSILLDFPLFMYNIFEYYSPSTFTEHIFDVNDEITLNSRSTALEIKEGNTEDLIKEITEFPTTLKLTTPGLYMVSQTPISGERVDEFFFVKTPADECNISEELDSLTRLHFAQEENKADIDLLLYFALALVALLFVEWWLQSREQF